MYFGWATPLLMALVADGVPRDGRRGESGSGRIVGTTFVAAWAAYLPFLVAGYEPIVLGEVRLPVSVAAASLNVAAWWWFAAWYARSRRGLAGDPGRWLVDGAVALLVAASVGALWPAATIRPAWRFVLVLVAVRMAAGAMLVVPGWAAWGVGRGLRVLHLHVMGLGVLTGGLVAAPLDRGLLTGRLARLWRVAITAVLASVVLLTDLWPAAVRGSWALLVVAAVVTLPLGVAVGSLVVGARAGRGCRSGAGGHDQAVDRGADALVGLDLAVDTLGPVDAQSRAVEVGGDTVGRDQTIRVGRAADAVGEVGQVVVDDHQPAAGGDRGRGGAVG